MGSYILYKCIKTAVDYVSDMPLSVRDYIDGLNSIPSKDEVCEYLQQLVDKETYTQEQVDEIITYLDKMNLYEYDLVLEYD